VRQRGAKASASGNRGAQACSLLFFARFGGHADRRFRTSGVTLCVLAAAFNAGDAGYWRRYLFPQDAIFS